MKMIRNLAAFCAMLFLMSAAQASDIMVMNGYAPASLTPTARSGAVYFTLMNHGAETDTLIKIKTEAATTAEAHQTIDDNGVMKMRPLERLELKPHETLALEPGGTHIMLTGLKAPLAEGAQLELVLTFEKAGDVAVQVPVVAKLGAAASTEHTHIEGE